MIKKAGIGVIVFCSAGLLGIITAPRPDVGADSASEPVGSTTTTAPTEAHFVTSGEIVLGPAVLVVDDATLDGGQLAIHFDLKSLAPIGDAPDVVEQLGFGNSATVTPDQLDTVFPDQWEIQTDDRVIEGTVASPSARTARFDVGDDFDPDLIRKVRIVSYALLVPISADVRLAPDTPTVPVAPGVTARLLAVTEQSNTIVQIEMRSERRLNLDDLRVIGASPGWLSAVREAEGRPRWNLTYDASKAPEQIPITVEGAVWVTIDNAFDVPMDGSS
jgi:hypothetical protein